MKINNWRGRKSERETDELYEIVKERVAWNWWNFLKFSKYGMQSTNFMTIVKILLSKPDNEIWEKNLKGLLDLEMCETTKKLWESWIVWLLIEWWVLSQ